MPDVRQLLVLGALALVGLTPMPGHAAELPRPTPIDPKVDILGIRIGQTPAEIHAVLAKADPEGRFQEARTKDPTSAGDYISQIAFRTTKTDPKNPDQFGVVDTTQVLFSAPSSGNRSLAIERDVTYDENFAPVTSATVEALEGKYGVSPGLALTRNQQGISRFQKIMFSEDGRVRQTDPSYDSGICGRNVNEDFGSFSSKCRSAVLAWALEPSSDPSRVRLFSIWLKDHDFALTALRLDKEAAQKAHDAELARLKAGAAPAPRL